MVDSLRFLEETAVVFQRNKDPIKLIISLVTLFTCSGFRGVEPRKTSGDIDISSSFVTNALSGQLSGSPSQDPLDSVVDGNVYTNYFFGFSFTFPKGWKLVSAPSGSISSQRSKSSTTENQNSANNRPEGLVNTTLLVVVEGTGVKQVPQWQRITILANKMKDPALTIEDHLKKGADILKGKKSPVQMVGDPEPIALAGTKIWRQKMVHVENGRSYQLIMYAINNKGFALQFIARGPSDSDPAKLEGMLQAIRFSGYH